MESCAGRLAGLRVAGRAAPKGRTREGSVPRLGSVSRVPCVPCFPGQARAGPGAPLTAGSLRCHSRPQGSEAPGGGCACCLHRPTFRRGKAPTLTAPLSTVHGPGEGGEQLSPRGAPKAREPAGQHAGEPAVRPQQTGGCHRRQGSLRGLQEAHRRAGDEGGGGGGGRQVGTGTGSSEGGSVAGQGLEPQPASLLRW